MKKTKKRELRVFLKTINELKLENIECIVIYEDSTSNEIYDGLNIRTINIQEFLIFSNN